MCSVIPRSTVVLGWFWWLCRAHIPSTRRSPASTARTCGGSREPMGCSSIARSTVNNCDTLTTDGFGRPPARCGKFDVARCLGEPHVRGDGGDDHCGDPRPVEAIGGHDQRGASEARPVSSRPARRGRPTTPRCGLPLPATVVDQLPTGGGARGRVTGENVGERVERHGDRILALSLQELLNPGSAASCGTWVATSVVILSGGQQTPTRRAGVGFAVPTAILSY